MNKTFVAFFFFPVKNVKMLGANVKSDNPPQPHWIADVSCSTHLSTQDD